MPCPIWGHRLLGLNLTLTGPSQMQGMPSLLLQFWWDARIPVWVLCGKHKYLIGLRAQFLVCNVYGQLDAPMHPQAK